MNKKSLATITVTLNDYTALESMRKYYDMYKSEVKYHIIVDNGSEENFKKKLKTLFSDSILIFRDKNGGTTAAYNEGIKYAIEKRVDSIMLLAADIEIGGESIRELNHILFSKKENGIVAPVLMMAHSDIIEQYGTDIKANMMVERRFNGVKLSKANLSEVEEVDMLPGGACLGKREVYEKVGYQDEKLFMYGDETDYAMRTREAGFKLIVTSKAKAWHQHIQTENKLHSSGLSTYYINRNILLLNYKYNNFFLVIKTFLYLFLFRAPLYSITYIKNRESHKIKIYIQGLFDGLLKKVKNRTL